MHAFNAAAWLFVGLCLVDSALGLDKLWIIAIVCACLNVVCDFLRRKENPGSAVELKNLPRNKGEWEVAIDTKLLDCWYSVIRSTEKCLLVRSRQKLPKRFTTSEPVAVSLDD